MSPVFRSLTEKSLEKSFASAEVSPKDHLHMLVDTSQTLGGSGPDLLLEPGTRF